MQKVKETCVALWHTTEFCRCNKSFVSANSETEICWESIIIHFPTTLPCSTRVDVLETGDVPFLSTLSQMKNLHMTIELDPKGDKFTCSAFWACTPLQQSIPQRDIVFDLTSLACQPKSRERHLTFALSEQKSAHPAHTQWTKMKMMNLFHSVPNRSSDRKRLSMYNWNPGPRRGREGALKKQIAGKWHVITLQEAIEYVDHELLTNGFPVTHYGVCAVPFKNDTFFPDVEVKSIHLHDTRSELPDKVMEGDQGWVLQGVLSRASFRR